MTSIQPKISIITVARNAAGELKKTIASVLEQDYPSIEIIIIDGGSTDSTIEMIKSYAGQIGYWISEPDQGIYDAMNKGIYRANGEWILFLNAGDVFAGRQILSQVFTVADNYADIIYGDSIADYGRFRVLQKAHPINDLWKGMPFCHQAMLTRTRLLKTGGFSTEYLIAADFDLVFRLFTEKRKFYYVPGPICIFDVSGISNRNYIQSWKERYIIVKRYGIISNDKKLYYAFIFLIFLFTLIGYKFLPKKLMFGIIKFGNKKNVISMST